MPHRIKSNRPRVFLSFAGDNRDKAKLLAEELKAWNFDAFIDEHSIPLGQDILLSINDALTQYDYFVLLWSRHTVDRPWVELEWSAALSRDLNERRSFLFLVRLDDTDPPALLAPRRYLDADDDWPKVAKELVGTWRQDTRLEMPVLPAPCPEAVNGEAIVLYVRNRFLKVAHVLAVPARTTSADLLSLVRSALALPTDLTKLDGAVGMRFTYQLQLPLGVTDGAVIDLEVRVEWFDVDGPVATRTYRTEPKAGITPKMAEAALNSAFDHLLPR